MEPKLKIVRTIVDPPSAREALADAIARRDALVASRAANEEKHSQLERKVFALVRVAEQADEVAKNAALNLQEHLLRAALGEDEPAPPSPKEARAKVQAHVDELDALRLERDAAADATKVYDGEIRTAQWRIDERIRDVLDGDSSVAEVLQRFRAAYEMSTVLRVVLDSFGHDVLPRNWHSLDNAWYEKGRLESEKWRTAIKALSTDATASLPEI
jgi:hypothetical protein